MLMLGIYFVFVALGTRRGARGRTGAVLPTRCDAPSSLCAFVVVVLVGNSRSTAKFRRARTAGAPICAYSSANGFISSSVRLEANLTSCDFVGAPEQHGENTSQLTECTHYLCAHHTTPTHTHTQRTKPTFIRTRSYLGVFSYKFTRCQQTATFKLVRVTSSTMNKRFSLCPRKTFLGIHDVRRRDLSHSRDYSGTIKRPSTRSSDSRTGSSEYQHSRTAGKPL